MTATDLLVPCDGCGGKCTRYGLGDYKVQRLAGLNATGYGSSTGSRAPRAPCSCGTSPS